MVYCTLRKTLHYNFCKHENNCVVQRGHCLSRGLLRRVGERAAEQMKAMGDGARVIGGRSSLWRCLPGDRAAVSCGQPESNSPSAVQTLLHLDRERGDHSVRSFVSSASATAVSAVADAALAPGGGSTPRPSPHGKRPPPPPPPSPERCSSPIGKRPPRAQGQTAPRRTSVLRAGGVSPLGVQREGQGQGLGQGQGESRDTKSAPPLRASVPPLEPAAAPPARPDQAPAQPSPGEVARQRSKERSDRFRELKQLAETDWAEVQTALLFGNEWCVKVTEADIINGALDFLDI